MTKLTALTAATAITDDDLIYVVDAPGGTPASKKITVANMAASATQRGLVELATTTEAAAGVDTERAVTAAGVAAYVNEAFLLAPEPSGGDDTAAIQALLDIQNGTGLEYNNTVMLRMGTYRIDSPLNLCNRQNVRLIGAGNNGGTVIDARTTDKAAIEIIGSKNIQIENLEIVGHATSTPAIGIWTGRSSVSIDVARFNFRNVDFTGSFTLACWLVTGAESHHWENCSTYITNAGCDAGILFDYRNALSGITPDNATLNLTYDTAICRINNSFITCANTATAFMPIYVYAGAAPTIRDTYLVAYGAPIIYARGGCTGLMLDNVAVEGTPTYLLHITSDATYNVSSKVSDFKLENTSLPSSICSSGYSVYAEDTTLVRNALIAGCGLIDDLRFYDVEGCDFSRWGNYQAGGDYVATLTITNGSSNTRIYKNVDDIVTFSGSVSYNTTIFDDGIATVNTGTRFYIAPKVLTVTETWDPGSLVDGAAATTYIQVTGVTAAAYVALASFPSIVTTGWDISAYPTDGYVVVTITNRTGDTVDLASGTLRVVAMKVA